MGKVTDLRVYDMVYRLSQVWIDEYIKSVGFEEFLLYEMGIKSFGYNENEFRYQVVDEKKFAWYLLSYE